MTQTTQEIILAHSLTHTQTHLPEVPCVPLPGDWVGIMDGGVTLA